MKHILLIASLAIMSTYLASSQTPRYTHFLNNAGVIGFSTNSQKIQSLYGKSSFASAPKGAIASLYLRVGRKYATTPTSITYHNFRLRMGYLNDNDTSFPPGTRQFDTFKTGLNTIIDAPTYVFTGVDTVGKWIKLPINGNFFFDPAKAFVVEVSHGPEGSNNYGGFDWRATNFTPNVKKSLVGEPDSIRTSVPSAIAYKDLGFDMVTTDVDGLTNLTAFGLFPNPSIDGHVNVSFDAQQTVNDASVTVSSVTGQQVMKLRFQNAGKSFFREVDMSAMPKGVYVLRLEADGEVITRRVVLQ